LLSADSAAPATGCQKVQFWQDASSPGQPVTACLGCSLSDIFSLQV
jgi:hypothetical protein